MSINSGNYNYKIGGTPANTADVMSPEEGVDKTGLNLNVNAFKMEQLKRQMVRNDPIIKKYAGTSFVNPAYIPQTVPVPAPVNPPVDKPKEKAPEEPNDGFPKMPAGIIEPVTNTPVAQFLTMPEGCVAEMKFLSKHDLGSKNKYIFEDIEGKIWYVNVVKNGKRRDQRFAEMEVGQNYRLMAFKVIPQQGGDPFIVIDLWKR